MKSISILFLLLKDSRCINIQTQDGDISAFVYELYTKFDHETNPMMNIQNIGNILNTITL